MTFELVDSVSKTLENNPESLEKELERENKIQKRRDDRRREEIKNRIRQKYLERPSLSSGSSPTVRSYPKPSSPLSK